MLNWIVSVLSDDLPDFSKVWFARVELEVGGHVVEEHSLVLFEFLLVDSGVDLQGFSDSVLQLQVVG
jgi:hypothetical protein